MNDYKAIRELFSREDALSIRHKMDAVNLTGVWPDMPQGQQPVGHGRAWYAGRLYLELLAEEQARRRKRRKKESPADTQKRLLEQMIKRLQQEDEQDFAVLMAI